MIKLSIALLLGMSIGLERQLKHKPLGLKTSTIICVASCLVTIVSIQSFQYFATPEYNSMDPMRLAAQIVSGVGFLGAGVILRRNNDVISGLTTAAMIWAASGLGIAVGAGFYFEATFAVLLIIITVNGLPQMIKAIGPSVLRKRDVAVRVVLNESFQISHFPVLFRQWGTFFSKERPEMSMRNIIIKDLKDGNHQLDLIISIPERRYVTDIYNIIKQTEEVIHVSVEELD